MTEHFKKNAKELQLPTATKSLSSKKMRVLKYNSTFYTSSVKFNQLVNSDESIAQNDQSLITTGKQTASQNSSLLNAFAVFDQNGDGRITPNELIKVFNGLGVKMTKNDAKQMITDADKNENGTIEYCEFVQLMSQSPPDHEAGNEEVELLEVFKSIDSDGNGFITCEELKNTLRKVMMYEYSLADIEQMMNEVDLDGNGFIDFHEFIIIVARAKNLK
jgi:Ca2+-binding EF-hand superfamily protein